MRSSPATLVVPRNPRALISAIKYAIIDVFDELGLPLLVAKYFFADAMLQAQLFGAKTACVGLAFMTSGPVQKLSPSAPQASVADYLLRPGSS